MRHRRSLRRAVTLTEMLVVIGVIIFLSGFLLAALTAVKGSGKMTNSMSRMRQIAIWVRSYSSDHREVILPSRFDYSGADYKGKVRNDEYGALSTVTAATGENAGTWTDILWTINEVGVFPDKLDPAAPDYRFDSPDQALYEKLGRWDDNPMRAAASNLKDFNDGTGPRPFGSGAQEAGEPGYFAANNFFYSRDESEGGNGWFTTGQIRAPDRSMYLVDCFAGETIGGPTHEIDGLQIDWEVDFDNSGDDPTGVVDFRYNDQCLMMFLDGHVNPENGWETIEDLEGDPADPEDQGRGIRVRELTAK